MKATVLFVSFVTLAAISVAQRAETLNEREARYRKVDGVIYPLMSIATEAARVKRTGAITDVGNGWRHISARIEQIIPGDQMVIAEYTQFPSGGIPRPGQVYPTVRFYIKNWTPKLSDGDSFSILAKDAGPFTNPGENRTLPSFDYGTIPSAEEIKAFNARAAERARKVNDAIEKQRQEAAEKNKAKKAEADKKVEEFRKLREQQAPRLP